MPRLKSIPFVSFTGGVVLAALFFGAEATRVDPRSLLVAGMALALMFLGHLGFSARRQSELSEANQQLRGELAERKRTEATLRNSEENYRLLFEKHPHPMWLFDLDSLAFLQVNEAAVHRYGYTRQEFLGMTVKDIRAPEEISALLADLERRGPELDRAGMWRHRKKDGTILTVEIVTHGLTFEGRRARLVLAQDVTQREATEAALRASDERFRTLYELAPDAMFVTDSRGMFLSGNRAAEALVGSPRQELLGKSFLELNLLPEKDLTRAADSLQQSARGNPTGPEEFSIVRKDGTRTPVEIRTFPITLGGRPAMLGVARDLTERRLLDERLRELSLAVEQSPTSILITDLSGRIEYVNPKLCQLTGYTTQELLGQTPRLFNSGLTNPEIYREMWSAIRAGKEWRGEFQNRRKDGSFFWESAVISPLRNADGQITHFVAVKEDITEQKRTEAALRESEESYRRLFELSPDAILIQKEGRFAFLNPAALKLFGAERAEQLIGRPIVDRIHPDFRQIVAERISDINREQRPQPTMRQVYVRLDGTSLEVEAATAPLLIKGQPAALVIVRDLSERTSLEKQLLRAQRLDSIGTLAAGIAHDLNNILAPIMLSAQMLQLGRPKGDEAEMLATIQESARRGADIVKQVLTFARGVEGKRITLQVRHLIREVQKLAQETFPKGITIEAELPKDLWPVIAEPTQLHQVLLNLCVNARDAMPDGGTLRISASNITVPEASAGLFAEGRPGPHVLIQVSDTGHGIPEGILDKIFEPFFTTKEQGKGTGLGLSTVLGIVRSHDGFVDVESKPGQGSIFKAYIPAVPGETVGKVDRTAVPSLPQGKGECVLVVDDEAAIRSITERTLTQNGYRVLSAANGREALAAIAAHPGGVQVVVTDIMMPVMDGVALIEALQQSPKLPVIACTGWGQQGIRARLEAMGVKMLLEKPYPATELLNLLPQALAPSTCQK